MFGQQNKDVSGWNGSAKRNRIAQTGIIRGACSIRDVHSRLKAWPPDAAALFIGWCREDASRGNAVLNVIEDGDPPRIRAVARRLGIPESTLRLWWHQWRSTARAWRKATKHTRP